MSFTQINQWLYNGFIFLIVMQQLETTQYVVGQESSITRERIIITPGPPDPLAFSLSATNFNVTIDNIQQDLVFVYIGY